MSQQYGIDSLLALAGLSEYTFMNWQRIREPYVRKLLNKRALSALLFTIVFGLFWILIFVLVPGYRL